MKLLMLLLLALPVYAQFDLFGTNAKRIQGKPIGSLNLCADGDALTWVAANNRFECVTGGGGGGGGGTIATQAQAEAGSSNTVYMSPLRASQANKAFWPFAPSRETGSLTNDTIRLNCDLSIACAVLSEAVPAYQRTTDITMRVSGASGSGTAYIYYTPSTGVVYCDENTSATLTLSGCTAATTGGVPAGSIPLGRYDGAYTFDASNVFADPTTVAFSGNPNITSIVAGAGVSASRNAGTGQITVSTDTATIPTISGVAANSASYAETTNTNTAYQLTTASTIGTANTDGTCVWARIHTTSGSTPTLQVNSETARQIWKHQGTTAAAAISSGELIGGQNYQFCYDASLNTSGAWVVQNAGGGGGTTTSYVEIYLPVGVTNPAQTVSPSNGWTYRGSTNLSLTWPGGGNGTYPTVAAFTSTSADSSLMKNWIVLPENYDNSRSTSLTLYYMPSSSATTGQVVRWRVLTEKASMGAELSDDTFDQDTTLDSTVTITTGQELHSATISSLAMDSAAAGDFFQIGLYRNGASASDTLAGNAYLIGVRIRIPITL